MALCSSISREIVVAPVPLSKRNHAAEQRGYPSCVSRMRCRVAVLWRVGAETTTYAARTAAGSNRHCSGIATMSGTMPVSPVRESDALQGRAARRVGRYSRAGPTQQGADSRAGYPAT
ncbi:hypothetical protein GCM10027444_41480 [Actinopolyspora lacussalsi]